LDLEIALNGVSAKIQPLRLIQQVSIKTVQEYCARLKQKMGAANIRQLVRIAVLWRAGVAEIVIKAIRGE
jgi:hypothetical protein